MSMIKVLHVVQDMGIGGLENVIASVVLGLDRKRFEPHVWCLAGGGAIADDLVQNGVPLNILGMKTYHDPIDIIRLACHIKEARVNILHAHGYFACTFGRLAGILARVPVMLSHVHSTYYNYRRRHILIERFLSRFTDRIICVSKAVQEFVVDDEGISADRTCVIYNGVPPPEMPSIGFDVQNARKDMGFDPEDIVLIIVASLGPTKGHHDLLHALKMVVDSGVNVKLLIVGGGPLLGNLQRLTETLGIEGRVCFMGERRDVTPLRRICDICLLPAVGREGLGISLIEAAALGLPLIGTRLGGIPEIIEDQVNGLLVNPESPKELASAIIRLGKDQALRQRMGKAGNRIFEDKFTQDEMIQSVEDLYNQLLERKRHAF